MKKLLRLWAYFKRGHNTYLAYIVNFVNFVTITYSLIAVNLLHAPRDPLYFAAYATVFMILYIAVAALIGRADYSRGTLPVEQELAARNNPWVRDLAMALEKIAEGDPLEAKRILQRWHN